MRVEKKKSVRLGILRFKLRWSDGTASGVRKAVPSDHRSLKHKIPRRTLLSTLTNQSTMTSAADLRAKLNEKIEADRKIRMEEEERRRQEQLALEQAVREEEELLAQIAEAEKKEEEERLTREAAEREKKKKFDMDQQSKEAARLHAEQVWRIQSPAQASGSGA